MRHKAIFPILALIATASLCVTTAQIAYAQQQPIKRTDLLKTHLAEIEGKEMHVWVADIAPGATTGSHFHPTPRFVYVLEGAVILELDGKPPQTFSAGQAFVELPNERHNFSQHNIDLNFLLLQNSRGLIGAGGFKHAVAAVSKILADRHADQDIVIEDQDGVGPRRLHAEPLWACSGVLI